MSIYHSNKYFHYRLSILSRPGYLFTCVNSSWSVISLRVPVIWHFVYLKYKSSLVCLSCVLHDIKTPDVSNSWAVKSFCVSDRPGDHRLFCKGPDNILGFAGHSVSVKTTQRCHCRGKTTLTIINQETCMCSNQILFVDTEVWIYHLYVSLNIFSVFFLAI